MTLEIFSKIYYNISINFKEVIMKKFISFLLLTGLLTLAVSANNSHNNTHHNTQHYEPQNREHDNDQYRNTISNWIEVDGIEGGMIVFDEQNGKITDAQDSITKAHIPSSINGVTVEGISNDAFSYNKNLVSVVVPGTVEAIGFGTFAHCYGLESLVVEEGVEKIGVSAFYKSEALQTLTLPSSLDDIDDTAFGLTGLTEVVIPEGVEDIGDKAFYGSVALKTVYLPSTLEEIGQDAFWQCHVLSDIYYGGTTEMWNNIEISSDNGELYTATLHDNSGEIFVPTIGQNGQMGWVEVAGIVGGKILFDKENGKILEAESSITIADIPSEIEGVAVEYLAPSLFAKSDELESLVIPGSIKEIPMNAFAHCDELKTVVIEEGVEEIGLSAFYKTEDLESLSLPSTLNVIGQTSFGLTGLETLIIPEGVEQIGKMAFYGSDDLKTVELPSSLRSIDLKVFWQCDDLERVEYAGTAAMWNGIDIHSNNKMLIGTEVYTSDGEIIITDSKEAAGNPSSWADPEIDKAKNNGLVIIMTGVPQYTDDITREQFAESIVNMVEVSTGKEIVPTTNPFTDTENIDIVKAYTIGVINGMTETTFEPDSLVNREQIAVMLYRASLYIAQNGGSTILTVKDDDIEMYDDYDDVSDWAKEAVSCLNYNGIMKGVSERHLSPKGRATVEQSILLISRMFDRK